MIFVSGLSILISIMARRPRDAILAAYAFGALWLLGSLVDLADRTSTWTADRSGGSAR